MLRTRSLLFIPALLEPEKDLASITYNKQRLAFCLRGGPEASPEKEIQPCPGPTTNRHISFAGEFLKHVPSLRCPCFSETPVESYC